jgi:hypothetical protein
MGSDRVGAAKDFFAPLRGGQQSQYRHPSAADRERDRAHNRPPSRRHARLRAADRRECARSRASSLSGPFCLTWS